MDGLNKQSVSKAVSSSRPEVIVHQMSALASMRSPKKFDAEFATTNRLRVEGTEYLLAAARAAGTRKIIAQSYTGWPNAREGSRVKTEDDPLENGAGVWSFIHMDDAAAATALAIERGEAGVSMMTSVRGSSNAKAKRAFGWQPAYPSWRDGFRRGLSNAMPPLRFPKAV